MTGGQLKAAIRARGLSQNEVARALGVTHGAVSLWVNGRRPIPRIVEVALRTIPIIDKPKKKAKAA